MRALYHHGLTMECPFGYPSRATERNSLQKRVPPIKNLGNDAYQQGEASHRHLDQIHFLCVWRHKQDFLFDLKIQGEAEDGHTKQDEEHYHHKGFQAWPAA